MFDDASTSRRFWSLQFRLRFVESKGSEFQTLVRRLMELRFPLEYVSVKPAGRDGDWSNDGLLREQRVLMQVYAPEGFDKAKTLAKIAHDFSGAVSHWSDLFDTWVLVHNSMDGLPPYAVADLEARVNDDGTIRCGQWSYAVLSKHARELADDELYELLGPAVTHADMLGVEIADVIPLLKAIEDTPPAAPGTVGAVPADKLYVNGLSENAEYFLLLGMRRSNQVQQYFDGQTQRPLFRDDLGQRFHAMYLRLQVDRTDPDSVLDGLVEWIVGPGPSAKKQAAGWAVVAFFFEQCDIFEAIGVEPSKVSVT